MMAETGAPQFGEFQAVRVLNQVGAATIFAARKASDAGQSAYAVKSLQLETFLSADETASRLQQFIRRAALQKKAAAAAAASGEQGWAPVHGEPQAAEDRAYYVTDLYPRSAEDLCGGRRGTVDATDLWRIVDSVVAALRVLDRVAHRPHGNLKPGNVLLAGRGAALRAFLADPLPDDAGARAAGLAADLAAIGRLLYRLVLHEQPPSDSRVPAPPAAPWSALGRTGDGWRQLCNRLLGADGPIRSLEEVAQALRPMAPAGPGRKRSRLVLAGALVALLAMGGAAGHQLYQRRYDFDSSNDFSQRRWDRFCDTWPRLDSLRSQATIQSIRREGMADLADRLERERLELKSPPALAESPYSVDNLRGTAPAAVRHNRYAGWMTARAVNLFDTAEASFANWPKKKLLEDYVKKCEPGEVKVRLAGYLRRLNDNPDDASIADVAEGAKFAIAAKQAGVWSSVVAKIAPVRIGRGDAVLSAYATRMADIAAGRSDVEPEELNRLVGLGERLSKVNSNQFDRGRIANDVSDHQPLGSTPTAAEFEAWLAKTADYEFLRDEDPLKRDNWPDELAKVTGTADKVRELARQKGISVVESRAGKIQADLLDLARHREELAVPPPVRADRPRLEAEVKEVGARLAALRTELGDELLPQVNQTAEQWMAREIDKQLSVPLPTALDEYRKEQVRRLGDSVKGGFLLGEAIRQEKVITQWVTDVARVFDVPQTSDELFQQLAKKERDEQLAKAVAGMRPNPVDRVTLDNALRECRKDRDAWVVKAKAFIEDGATLRALLADWYNFAPGSKDEVRLSVAYDRWTRSGLVDDAAALSPAAAALRRDLDRLKTVDPAVLNAPDAADPRHLLAAWRANDKLPLRQELKVRESLKKRIGSVSAPRQTELSDELEKTSTARWLRHVQRPATAQDVIDARDVRDSFAVPANLDPVADYNLKLADLIASDPDRLSEEDARQSARAFIGAPLSIRAMARSTRIRGRIDDLRKRLEKAEKQRGVDDGGPPGPRPENGWVCVDPDLADRRTFRRERPPALTLEFALISTGDEQTWLSTTEVSLALFAGAIGRAEENQYVRFGGDNLEIFTGPSVWEIDQKRIVHRKAWIRSAAPDVPGPPPSDEHPVNCVSLTLARAWCKSLGCRLPTSKEWAEARRVEEEDAGGVPRTWNLRDKSWRDYVTAIKARYPDPAGPRAVLMPSTDAWSICRIDRARKDEPDEVWNDTLKGIAIAGDPRVYNDDRLLPDTAQPSERDRNTRRYGKTFYHIVGNLAELVDDAGVGSCVGGSAFSQPGQSFEKRVTVSSRNGYTDVGFRVAFPAGTNFKNEWVAFAKAPPLWNMDDPN